MMMRRTENGTFEIGGRAFGVLMAIFAIGTPLFAAGAAWAGVQASLSTKVDKGAFVAIIAQRDSGFTIHVMQTALALDRLRVHDSLQEVASAEDRARTRDFVCKAIPGCR